MAYSIRSLQTADPPERSDPAYRPGVHSRNRGRFDSDEQPASPLRWVRVWLLLIGLAGVGYYCYAAVQQYAYESYENWAFDQHIAGRVASVADYLRERTLLGKVWPAEPETKALAPHPAQSGVLPPTTGELLGRVQIDRLHLSAIVREGVDPKTLSVAVGHVPSTALPGQNGNFAIAAHRDSLFRALKDIHQDDVVTFESPSGVYRYRVMATKIVKPSDVAVLKPDGGGLIATTGKGKPAQLLTMITCYPFYYVGSAPNRFIVEAMRMTEDSAQAEALNFGSQR